MTNKHYLLGTLLGLALVAGCGGGRSKDSVGSVSSDVQTPAEAPANNPQQNVTGGTDVSATGVPSVGGTGVTATTPPAPTYDHEWYVAASGNDANPGTSAQQAFATIQHAINVAGPGDRINVAAGTYAEQLVIGDSAKAGSAQKPVTLQGAQGAKILHASGSTVLMISRPYWIVDGFEIDSNGAQAFAVSFMGDVTGSTLQKSFVHHGSLGAGVATFGNANGAIIQDNVIKDFVRPGDDSHGVNVEPTSKNITVRRNKISGNSGDAFQCTGPEGYSNDPPADGVLVEDNEMFGDFEQAVDIKTCFNVTIRRNYMHDYLAASVIHMSAKNVLFEDNRIEHVGKAIALGGNHTGPVPSGVVIRGNKISDVTTANGMEGIGIVVENADHPVIEHNTILNTQVGSIKVGGGEGGNTESPSLIANILTGPSPVIIGGYAPGVSSKANLFETGAKVTTPSGVVLASTWATSLGDSATRTAAAPLATAEYQPATAAVDAAPAEANVQFCGAAPDIGAVETGCSK